VNQIQNNISRPSITLPWCLDGDGNGSLGKDLTNGLPTN